MENFANLLNDTNYFDITLVVGKGKDNKREFRGHKAIFAAQSPVFAKMFQSDLEESKSNPVDITDIVPRVFEQFMKFIYTGKVDPAGEEMCDELLVVADKVTIVSFSDKFLSF